MAIFISSVYFEQVLCAEINVLLLPRTHAANLTPRSFVFIKVAPRRQKNGRFGSQLLLSEHNHFSIDENNCFTFVGPIYKTLQTFAANSPTQECAKTRGAIWTRDQPKNPLNVPKRSCLQLAAVNTGALSRHMGETKWKTHRSEHCFPPGKVGARWWLRDWALLFVEAAWLQHKAICSTKIIIIIIINFFVMGA